MSGSNSRFTAKGARAPDYSPTVEKWLQSAKNEPSLSTRKFNEVVIKVAD